MEQAVYEFERLIEEECLKNPELHTFVKEIHEGTLTKDENGQILKPNPESVHFSNISGDFGFIMAFVGPILFRWAMNFVQSDRAHREFEAAKERIDYVLYLTEIGIPQETAAELLKITLDALAKRNNEGDVVEKILALAIKAQNQFPKEPQ